VAHDILIQELRTGDQSFLNAMGDGVVKEPAPENYLIRRLLDLDGINYDRFAPLLHKLAGQVVIHYRGLLKDESALHNVLLFKSRFLAAQMADQMDQHYQEPHAEFEARCYGGYEVPKATDFESDGTPVLPLRGHVEPLSAVPKKVFGSLKKCMYPFQRFDSNPERVLAIVLENDPEVLRWVRPVRDLLRITVSNGTYKPDFVVETTAGKWVLEVKAENELKDADVQEKAAAGRRWCEAASQFDGQGRPWTYLLLPDKAIHEGLSYKGLEQIRAL
jgi:type III restriction enzyme